MPSHLICMNNNSNEEEEVDHRSSSVAVSAGLYTTASEVNISRLSLSLYHASVSIYTHFICMLYHHVKTHAIRDDRHNLFHNCFYPTRHAGPTRCGGSVGSPLQIPGPVSRPLLHLRCSEPVHRVLQMRP